MEKVEEGGVAQGHPNAVAAGHGTLEGLARGQSAQTLYKHIISTSVK